MNATDPDEPVSTDLARAAAELRRRPLPRAVEIADAVLEKALRTPRVSVLVRGRAPYDFLQVASTALTTVLRARVDAALAGAAVNRVLLDVDRDGTLESLTLELLVQYGEPIAPLADRTRAVVHDALVDLLGPQPTDTQPDDPVRVAVQHVHVADVTVGDPRLVDPGDEAR